MTLTIRQAHVLEGLLRVEQGREAGRLGAGASASEVRRELGEPLSINVVRKELNALAEQAAPRLVNRRRLVGSAGGLYFTLTMDGRVRARSLAAAHAALSRGGR